ncbi:MAG: restriction endonuclease [Lachnospiraceae bacterium]|nr:restriction endonuclease [Lachnospiraceae bacterium]
MGRLNYNNIDPTEFEALARDVMSRKLGVSLNRYGAGKDGGIDLSDDACNPTIIVQCKRYDSSSSATDTLVKERAKIDKYGPSLKQYYVFTSTSLLPQQIAKIRDAFGSYMASDDNIIYNEKIEDFFNEAKNADIMEKHLKLFVSFPDWYHFNGSPNINDIPETIELKVVLKNDKVCLSDTTEDALKALWHRRKAGEKKALKVAFILTPEDFEEIAAYIFKNGYFNHADLPTVRALLSNQAKNWKRAIEYGSEAFLMYLGGCYSASEYFNHFLDLYGADRFIYKDEYNVDCCYEEVYFWVTVLNEMINNILIGRFKTKPDKNDYCRVVFFMPDKRMNKWYFSAYIKAEKEIMIASKGGFADIADFSPEEELYCVYPFLVESVGHMLTGHDASFPPEKMDASKLFNLLNYFVGPA